jgi:molybdopterin converting factor small subunit
LGSSARGIVVPNRTNLDRPGARRIQSVKVGSRESRAAASKSMYLGWSSPDALGLIFPAADRAPSRQRGTAMQIEVQLFSILRDLLPPEAERGRATIALAEGATVADLINHLGIDQQLGFEPHQITKQAGWQVMVADKFEQDMDRVLREGDEIKILPPIAGG